MADPLIKQLSEQLPSAWVLAETLTNASMALGELSNEIRAAVEDGDAIQFARSFVALRKLKDQIDQFDKDRNALYERVKSEHLPALFDAAGITSLPLKEGFRVGVSSTYRASIKADRRDEAWAWLRNNGLGDLIVETVNASTLSAAGKSMLEDTGTELPEDLFNAQVVPNTSVTAIPPK